MQQLAKQRCLLRKDQEEAQFHQQILLCALFVNGYLQTEAITIDASLVLLCMAHWHKLRRRCISLTDIAVNLGEDTSAALLAICAFSGCDTTSAFAGKGKTKAFRLASQSDCLRLVMTRVGCSLALTECEKFVCHLYGLPTCCCTSVNEVRYELFRMKCSKAQQMPPTRDALRQHVLRVNYLTKVCMEKDLCCMQNLPSPHG